LTLLFTFTKVVSRDRIPGLKGQRSRSHGHIMCTAKICLNSIPGGLINIILGG